MAEPLERSTAKSMALGVALQLILYCWITVGIWGFAVKAILWFVLIGFVAGLVVGLSSARTILRQTIRERAHELMYAQGIVWGGVFGIIGIAGLVYWLVRVLWFH